MTEQILNVFAFGMPGGWEWIVVLVIAVLLFGRRLPEIARSVGKSLTEFKKGLKEAQNEVSDVADDVDVVSPPDTSHDDTPNKD